AGARGDARRRRSSSSRWPYDATRATAHGAHGRRVQHSTGTGRPGRRDAPQRHRTAERLRVTTGSIEKTIVKASYGCPRAKWSSSSRIEPRGYMGLRKTRGASLGRRPESDRGTL